MKQNYAKYFKTKNIFQWIHNRLPRFLSLAWHIRWRLHPKVQVASVIVRVQHLAVTIPWCAKLGSTLPLYHFYSGNTRRRHARCNFKQVQRKTALLPNKRRQPNTFYMAFLCYVSRHIYTKYCSSPSNHKLLLLLLLLLLLFSCLYSTLLDFRLLLFFGS
jgi:hypothetical protein